MTDLEVLLAALSAHDDQLQAELKDPATSPERLQAIRRELQGYYTTLRQLA